MLYDMKIGVESATITVAAPDQATMAQVAKLSAAMIRTCREAGASTVECHAGSGNLATVLTIHVGIIDGNAMSRLLNELQACSDAFWAEAGMDDAPAP